ncbi:hypothetical protein ACFCXH_00670 [Streptomyces nojiriensis]|uniref:hypothetical protein n=1 Tax=Streptomyces nojiriensis TaxID=66374 RepID=UPI0035DF5878
MPDEVCTHLALLLADTTDPTGFATAQRAGALHELLYHLAEHVRRHEYAHEALATAVTANRHRVLPLVAMTTSGGVIRREVWEARGVGRLINIDEFWVMARILGSGHRG